MPNASPPPAPAHLQIAFAQAAGLPVPQAHVNECETCSGTGRVITGIVERGNFEATETEHCADCDETGQVLVPGAFQSAAVTADELRTVLKPTYSHSKLIDDDKATLVYAAAQLEHLQRELADALARNGALTKQLEHQTAERVRAEVELHDLQQHVAGVEREMAESDARVSA